MLTITDMNKEQLIELIKVKDKEIAQLKEDITVLEGILKELFSKVNAEKDGSCGDGCCCSCEDDDDCWEEDEEE